MIDVRNQPVLNNHLKEARQIKSCSSDVEKLPKQTINSKKKGPTKEHTR